MSYWIVMDRIKQKKIKYKDKDKEKYRKHLSGVSYSISEISIKDEKDRSLKERKKRKRVSILVFMVMFASYTSLVAYNAYIIWSLTQIDVDFGEMQMGSQDNETIVLSGDFSITSKIDITDFLLNIQFSTDNDLLIKELEIAEDRIPANEETKIEYNFEFRLDKFDLETLIALNNSEYILFDGEFSLNYGLYNVKLEISHKLPVEEVF